MIRPFLPSIPSKINMYVVFIYVEVSECIVYTVYVLYILNWMQLVSLVCIFSYIDGGVTEGGKSIKSG